MLEVIDPGPLTSVQTPSGRPGWQRFGVPVGGAADPWSARLANRLVGNADDAPLLEATLAGPTLRFDTTTAVALVGAWNATLDGMPLSGAHAHSARAGARLAVGTGSGARAYLAVAGLVIEPVLGSASTDLRTGFGGHLGRALREGDLLQIAPRAIDLRRWRGSDAGSGPIRIVTGPHAARFAADALTGGMWHVTDAADRTGVRLSGDPVGKGDSEVASFGLPLGAVQIPPDGQPIVMLADRPVTGGYPVPACVIRADVGRVAQLRPGDEVRFASVSVEEAIQALRRAEADLDELEHFTLSAEEETGWAGSLE